MGPPRDTSPGEDLVSGLQVLALQRGTQVSCTLTHRAWWEPGAAQKRACQVRNGGRGGGVTAAAPEGVSNLKSGLRSRTP